MNVDWQEKARNIQYISGLLIRLALNRQLSGKKARNFIKNIGSALLHRANVAKYPSVMQIDPNNICNLRCTACPTGLGEHPKPRGQMSFEAFVRIVDEVRDHVFIIVLYNSGEPILNKDIFRMIRYASDNHIAVITSTNGNIITEEDGESIVESGLDTLIISISGLTQDIYSKYHVGGDIEKVFKGISIISQKKKEIRSKTPRIILRFLQFDYNCQEREKWESIIKEKKLGVDYFSPRLACRELRFIEDEAMPSITISVDNNNGHNGNHKNSHCYWLWMLPVVNYDGTVIPCCHINLRPPEMGNIFEHPGGMRGIWMGDRYMAMRKAILEDKKQIPSCRECISNPFGFQDSFNKEMGFVMKAYRSMFRKRRQATRKEVQHT